jgi:hypothetical protein
LGNAHLKRILCTSSREAAEGMRLKVTQYKAEHSIALQQDGGECKVFKVRRVSLGLQLGSA